MKSSGDFLSLVVQVDLSDVVESLSRNTDHDNVVELVDAIDKSFEDWEVTEAIAKHFVKEMQGLKEDPQDLQDWIQFLKDQLKELENV